MIRGEENYVVSKAIFTTYRMNFIPNVFIFRVQAFKQHDKEPEVKLKISF